MIKYLSVFLWVGLMWGGCATEEQPMVVEEEVDLGSLFGGIDPDQATFVVFDSGANTFIRHNPARGAERFIPASTYKIPHSVIALETGVASGAEHVIPWDSTANPRRGFWPEIWSEDHTLKTAIRNSVVWYYQEFAREIGPERMQHYVDTVDYGNKNIDGEVDLFWLTGDLRISANEQVAFLKKLYEGKLPVSETTTETVKEILVLEEAPDYILSGKTGTANLTDTWELLWLVGYVERDENVWYYAFNMDAEQAWELWGTPANGLAW